MLWVQTHYVLLWCQGLRVDFISCVSLASVCAVYAWAPIMSCFLLLVIILLPYGYFWDFFFSIAPPYVKETHTTSSNALTLFPCTCHPALLHGQMHSTPNTKHSAQQHLIQDLTHNQPGGKTAGVVWLGESGGWRMVFIDIVSRGMWVLQAHRLAGSDPMSHVFFLFVCFVLVYLSLPWKVRMHTRIRFKRWRLWNSLTIYKGHFCFC